MDNNKVGLIEKIKLLMWLNNLTKGGSNKMGNVLAKLDGLKSVVGLLMVTAYYAAPQFGIVVPDAVLKIGAGIAGVGLTHKLEKGVGALSKVIDVAIKALEVTKKVVAAVPKEEEKK